MHLTEPFKKDPLDTFKIDLLDINFTFQFVSWREMIEIQGLNLSFPIQSF